MRLITVLVSTLLPALLLAESEDLRWCAGSAERTALAESGHRVVVYFSGHCPKAAEFVNTSVKKLHDTIEREHLPVWLILRTPDKAVDQLLAYQERLGLEGALFAHDAGNPLDISLNNIYQVRLVTSDGKTMRLSASDSLAKDVTAAVTKLPPPPGLGVEAATEAGRDLLWGLERERPGALAAVVKAKRQRGEVRDDAEAIYEAFVTRLEGEAATLVAAEASFETWEALDLLLARAEGIRLSEAQKRHRELGREPEIKNEIVARSAYQKCAAMFATGRRVDEQRARKGLEMIAARYPDTVYGARAQADLVRR